MSVTFSNIPNSQEDVKYSLDSRLSTDAIIKRINIPWRSSTYGGACGIRKNRFFFATVGRDKTVKDLHVIWISIPRIALSLYHSLAWWIIWFSLLKRRKCIKMRYVERKPHRRKSFLFPLWLLHFSCASSQRIRYEWDIIEAWCKIGV